MVLSFFRPQLIRPSQKLYCLSLAAASLIFEGNIRLGALSQIGVPKDTPFR